MRTFLIVMREFLHEIFNMQQINRTLRVVMLCWTSMFSCYELAEIFISQSPLLHVVCLIIQVTTFVIYYRATVASE
jgi:hypothetical protein